MKYGILTFQDTTNYGALLQAFAMQNTFYDIGVDAEIIDYQCENIVARELPESIFAYGIFHIPGAILNKIILTEKHRKLEKFKKLYCKLSKKQYNKSSICNAVNRYDGFISGSDIIWELNVTGQDTTYYLDFVVDKMKYAFSSSFGYTEIPECYRSISKDLLLKYNRISVREDESARIIKNLLGKNVPVTLDPTLLLNAEKWRSYEQKVFINRRYVLVYFDDKDHLILDYAKKIAQEKEWEVVYLSEKVRGIQGVHMIRAVSVGQFLWLIDHAEFVVTASFHGVAFSINFNTPFCYLNRSHQGRINTLMRKMNISDRDLRYNEITPLYWEEINDLLEEERGQTLEYLNQMFGK